MQYELIVGVTTKCNGICKFCARNNINFNEGVDLNYELDLELLKPHLPNFKSLIFVGGFGEAVLHSKFLSFLDYVNKYYPDMFLYTSSHMGIRSEAYWRELATKNIMLGANIDGIGELNNIYRGVNYNKCIQNLTAFIDAGGNATWSMIAFDYNKHQINKMRQIAKDIGCSEFNVRRSDRYYKDTPFYLTDENGPVTPRKEMPQTDPLFCEWEVHHKIFLNEFGIYSPCCHSDMHFPIVKNDEYMSAYYKNNDLSINNKFSDIIQLINNVYNNKYNINMCRKLCSISETAKKSSIFLNTTIFNN